MDRLHYLLGWMDRHSCLEGRQEARANARRALAFEPVDHLPVLVYTTAPPEVHARPYRYSVVFETPHKMLFNELAQHAGGVMVPDAREFTVRANFGVAILPSAFGCAHRIVDESMPWVEHVAGRDEIRRLVDAGLPSDDAGLLARCWDFYAYCLRILDDYPDLGGLIRLYHPDFQGPFDTAHLVWGPDIYVAMHDEPELVHAMLDLVTRFYSVAMNRYKRLVHEGNEWTGHWCFPMAGGIMIRNDSAVCVSRAMYDEFIRPYDERLLAEFGGAIHHCGAGGHFLDSLAETRGMAAVNFGEPDRQDLAMVLELFAERRIGLIGLPCHLPAPGLLERYRTGIVLTAMAPTPVAARALLRRMQA